MRALIGCLLLAGCPGTGTVPPGTDAPISSSDAAPQSAGLQISWSASPKLPGAINSGLTVTSAAFSVSRLQVIGDAGTDERTTARNLKVNWSGNDAPAQVDLSDAPTGLYSKITLAIDGHTILDYAYEIKGTVKVSGNTKDFEIRDRNSLAVEVDNFNKVLEPGRIVQMGIELHLKDALEGVDFQSLNSEDGKLVLDTIGPQMSDFRDALHMSFVGKN